MLLLDNGHPPGTLIHLDQNEPNTTCLIQSVDKKTKKAISVNDIEQSCIKFPNKILDT